MVDSKALGRSAMILVFRSGDGSLSSVVALEGPCAYRNQAAAGKLMGSRDSRAPSGLAGPLPKRHVRLEQSCHVGTLWSADQVEADLGTGRQIERAGLFAVVSVSDPIERRGH